MVSRSQVPSLFAAAVVLLAARPVYAAEDAEPGETVAPVPMAPPVEEAEPAASQPVPPSSDAVEAPEISVAHSEKELPPSVRRHWDAGLEIRYTQFRTKLEPMLHAQWLRHWPSGFKLGGFVDALAFEVKSEENGVKSRRHYYSLGATAEYDVIGRELDYPSLSLGANLGQGWLNHRTEEAGVKKFEQTEIYVVEPYLAAQFLHWRRLEWGIGIAYRVASSKDEKEVANGDIAGASVFLSARHEI